MAYNFVKASSQYITISNKNVVWSSKDFLTIACRINMRSLGNSERLIVGDDGNNSLGIVISNVNVIYSYSYIVSLGGLSDSIVGPTLVANRWYNCVGAFRPKIQNGLIKFFVDTTKYTSKSAGIFGVPGTDASNIHVAHRVSPASFADTRVAEIGIWDVELTDGECVSLCKNIKPTLIRPSNLINYTPLINNLVDLKANANVVKVNSPTVYPHPIIIG